MQIVTISNNDISLIKRAIQGHMNELDWREDRYGVKEKMYDELIESYVRLLRDIENIEKLMR